MAATLLSTVVQPVLGVGAGGISPVSVRCASISPPASGLRSIPLSRLTPACPRTPETHAIGGDARFAGGGYEGSYAEGTARATTRIVNLGHDTFRLTSTVVEAGRSRTFWVVGRWDHGIVRVTESDGRQSSVTPSVGDPVCTGCEVVHVVVFVASASECLATGVETGGAGCVVEFAVGEVISALVCASVCQTCEVTDNLSRTTYQGAYGLQNLVTIVCHEHKDMVVISNGLNPNDVAGNGDLHWDGAYPVERDQPLTLGTIYFYPYEDTSQENPGDTGCNWVGTGHVDVYTSMLNPNQPPDETYDASGGPICKH